MSSNRKINHIAFSSIIIVLTLATSVAIAAEAPWRLDNALDLPTGFSLSGSHRTRFENVTNNVRPGTSINDQALVFRTLLNAEYRNGNFSSQLELIDSRQELATDDSIIGTDVVDTLDILQANVNYAFGNDGQTQLKLGRFTADWGSRRLIARNRFRNTLNAFDGIELRHQSGSGNQLRFMASQPVQRLPGDRRSLLANEHEFDESSSAQRLYGVHATLPDLFDKLTTELYFYSLQEQDTANVNTRNRRLQSAGFRLTSRPEIGGFDWDLESVFQTGHLRSNSSSTNRSDLDHKAFFQFFMLGYSFDLPSRLRIMFEFDYASGDEDPFDQDNERFDSLFGVTTFEFGTGGLYGATSRSNVITPGIRITGNVTDQVNLMVSYRHFWLAERRDSWGRTGLRDTSGATDSYLGQHLETRLRWDIVPGNVRIEAGIILLQTKNLSNKNSDYIYGGAAFTF